MMLHTGQSMANDGPPSGDMSCPSEVVLQKNGFNAGDLILFQNFNISDEVTAANVQDGAETVLMKALEEMYVTAVGDPSL